MTDSPAFYEERIRLLQAENQRLRDALERQVRALEPLDSKIDFTLYVGTPLQMRTDLDYLRGLLGDALYDARDALGSTPNKVTT